MFCGEKATGFMGVGVLQESRLAAFCPQGPPGRPPAAQLRSPTPVGVVAESARGPGVCCRCPFEDAQIQTARFDLLPQNHIS